MEGGEATNGGDRCESCGEEFRANAHFCRGCGAARLNTPGNPTSPAEAPTEAQPQAQRPLDQPAQQESAAAPPDEAQHPAAHPTQPPAGYPTPPPGSPVPSQGGYPAPPPQAGYPTTPAPGYQPPFQAGYPAPPPGYPQQPQAGYPATPSGYQAPPPGYPGYAGQPPGYQPLPPGGYPTPAAGYPAQQAQAPLPQQQEEKRPAPSRWLIGGIAAAVVAIVGIGVAIVLATGGSSTQARLLAAPVVTGATSTPATRSSPAGRSSPRTHASTPRPSPASTSAPSIARATPRATISQQVNQQSAVESTIHQEFALISEHKFSAAYALLGPSLQTGEEGWVDSHRKNGIYNVNVATAATVNSPDSATASIIKMSTLDGEGCKSWSGSWGLTKISGQWRISEANITSTPC